MVPADPTSPVRFRAATPADDALLIGRLPGDRVRGVSFVGERFGSRIAAFAVAPPVERYEPEGLGVALHVEPGTPDAAAIAQQMVDLAARMADSAKLGPLHAWPFPAAGSPAERAYRRLGFEPFDQVTTWEVDTQHAKEVLLALVEPARSYAPDDLAWRVTDLPLRDADVDAVLDLYEARLARLSVYRETMARRLRGEGHDALHPIRSRVHTLDGQVLGVMLMEYSDALTWVRARIVAAGLGDGLLSVRQLADVCNALPFPADNRLRFETHDRHRQTVRLAKRLGAKPIATRIKLHRSHDNPPPEPSV